MKSPSAIAESKVLPLKEWLSAHRGEAADADGVPTIPGPEQALEIERARIYEAAWTEGYDCGMSEAKAKIEARCDAAERQWKTKYGEEVERLSAASARLKALESSMNEAVADLERRIETAVAEIAFAAVARIVASAARERLAVVDVCREALAEYPIRPVVLRVSRADLDVAKAAFSDADIRIEGDPALSNGECRLESAKGSYEASIEQRMKALMQQFIDAVGEGCASA